MLNTVVNPMLNTLGGGGNKGNQLVQFGGVCNSLAAVLVTIIMGSLIADATKAQISDATPALMIALGVFAFAFLVLLLVKIPEPELEIENKVQPNNGKKYSAFSFRHFNLGILAIFLYMGVEVGVPTYVMQYLTTAPDAATPGLGINAGIVGMIVAVYWLLMLVGRLLGGMLAGKVSSRAQISGVSVMCLVLVLLGMFLPSDVMVKMPGIDWATLTVMTAQVPVGIFALILVGLCTSVMWGGIFNMAVEGLGKYTSIASGAFMTMVCGGGILIPLQGKLADVFGDFQMSYIVVLACAAYILFYALVGSKNVNKDIPTE
jgi:FHS family L-fucose permease-like MFS transporter